MKNKVVELFAGVGGFRVGFNNVKGFDERTGRAIEENNFDFVWANQWEPGSTIQHAFQCYTTRFGNSSKHVCEDITKVDKESIPDHDILVGGFPCQDYSVARSLAGEKGIEGKKGVLWWEIYKTIIAKKPRYVFLENVDRLIKSPSRQRGRDFGIMLASLADLGYDVEWRVINAADYGFPQRRRRVYIFAIRRDQIKKIYNSNILDEEILQYTGVFAQNFPILLFSTQSIKRHPFITLDLLEITKNFKYDFENTGVCINGVISTVSSIAKQVIPTTLGHILQTNVNDLSLFISNERLSKWEYLKGSKKIDRTSKLGVSYQYSEGKIAFPDHLDKPGRTMLTSEGTLNRSSHIILDPATNKYRIITPIEAERLNGFPDDWTSTMNSKKRYFMMGNALVVGVVAKIGDYLKNR